MVYFFCSNNSYAKSYAENNNINHYSSDEYESSIYNGLYYTVIDNEVIITGSTDDLTNMVIPDVINGKPVKRICSYAFYENPNILSVQVYANLDEIGEFSFSNCSKLHLF